MRALARANVIGAFLLQVQSPPRTLIKKWGKRRETSPLRAGFESHMRALPFARAFTGINEHAQK